MKQTEILAQFRYGADCVELERTGEHLFAVTAVWAKPQGGFEAEDHRGVDLRAARIVFERLVNLAVCRMTLTAMYGKLGQTPPKGNGKYGLPG